MTHPQFDTPDDIRHYGRMIDDFSNASKDIANVLRNFSFNHAMMRPIIGNSPYNTLENQVVRGPEQYKKAVREPHEGLHGIFFLLHLPEMKMAKHMPGILGKEFGFCLKYMHEGQEYFVPLNTLKYDYIGRPAQIILSEAVTFTAANGASITLDKNTPVFADVISSSTNKLTSRPELAFEIVSGEGNPVEKETAAVIFWQSLGAQAMKSRTEPRREVLARFGTDDDFAAEASMIRAMNDLQNSHGVNLMPHFNAYVAQSMKLIEDNPAYMAAWRDAVAIKTRVLNKKNLYKHRLVANLDSAASSLQGVAEQFGIDITQKEHTLNHGSGESLSVALEERLVAEDAIMRKQEALSSRHQTIMKFERNFNIDKVIDWHRPDMTMEELTLLEADLSENESLASAMVDAMAAAGLKANQMRHGECIASAKASVLKSNRQLMAVEDLPEAKQKVLALFQAKIDHVVYKQQKQSGRLERKVHAEAEACPERKMHAESVPVTFNPQLDSFPPSFRVQRPVTRIEWMSGTSPRAMAK